MLNIKRIITNKQKGNIFSLIVGLIFLNIVLILIFFNFRMNMLSEVIYNIDDTITASVLGASLPNKELYENKTDVDGKIIANGNHQLVIDDNTIGTTESEFINESTPGENTLTIYNTLDNNKRYNEIQIVLSNENGKLISNGHYSITEETITENRVKKETDITKDNGYKKNWIDTTMSTIVGKASEKDKLIDAKTNARKQIKQNDYAISRMSDMQRIINNNITQSDTATNQTLVDATTGNVVAKVDEAMTIKKDSILDRSFIGDYLYSDMQTTRLQLYNLYRYTLAERHVYASPYLTYKVNGIGGYTWDGYEYTASNTSVQSTKPTMIVNKEVIDPTNPDNIKYEYGFSNAVKDFENSPYKINSSDKVSNPINIEIDDWVGPKTEDEFDSYIHTVYSDLDNSSESYKALKEIWERDYKNWESYKNGEVDLIFYSDTGVSCSTDWWGSPYNGVYSYLWDNNSQVAIPITQDKLIKDTTNRNLLPVEGYSVYWYTLGSNKINSNYVNFSNGDGILNSKSTQPIKLGDFNGDNVADDTISISDADSSDNKYKNRKTNGNIYYTSIYMELAYDITIFPRKFGLFQGEETTGLKIEKDTASKAYNMFVSKEVSSRFVSVTKAK